MKHFFICAAVVAAAAFGVMKANNVNSDNDLTAFQLDNVELLAEGDTCGSGWRTVTYTDSNDRIICWDPGKLTCDRPN